MKGQPAEAYPLSLPAQHGFRRQATPAGLAHPVAAQIVADQAEQWTMLIEPLRDLLQLAADLVRGEDIE
jgi:hypothetical protein